MNLSRWWNRLLPDTDERRPLVRALRETPPSVRAELAVLIRNLLAGEITIGRFWEEWASILGERAPEYASMEDSLRRFLHLRADPSSYRRINPADPLTESIQLASARWMVRYELEILERPTHGLPIPARPPGPSRGLPRPDGPPSPKPDDLPRPSDEDPSPR